MKRALSILIAASMAISLFSGFGGMVSAAADSPGTVLMDSTVYEASLMNSPYWTPVYLSDKNDRSPENIHPTADLASNGYVAKIPNAGSEDLYASMYIHPGQTKSIQPGGTTDIGFKFTAPATGIYRIDFAGAMGAAAPNTDGALVYIANSAMEQIASIDVDNRGSELSKNVELNAGEYIYFLVGCRYSYYSDSMLVSRLNAILQIEDIEEPEQYTEVTAYQALWGYPNYRGVYINNSTYNVSSIGALELKTDYFARIPGLTPASADYYAALYMNAGDSNRFVAAGDTKDAGFEFTAPADGYYKLDFNGFNRDTVNSDGMILKLVNSNSQVVGSFTVTSGTASSYSKIVYLNQNEKFYLFFNKNGHNWNDGMRVNTLRMISLEVPEPQPEYIDKTEYIGLWGAPNFKGVYMDNTSYQVSSAGELVLDASYFGRIPGLTSANSDYYAALYMNAGDSNRFAAAGDTKDAGFEFTAPVDSDYRFDFTGYNGSPSNSDGMQVKLVSSTSAQVGGIAVTSGEPVTYNKVVHLAAGEKLYVLFNKISNPYNDRLYITSLKMVEVELVGGPVTETSAILGDSDGSFEVDILDIVALRNHIIGKTPVSEAYTKNSDINFDNSISIVDLLCVKQFILTGIMPDYSDKVLKTLTPDAVTKLGLIYYSNPLNIQTKGAGFIRLTVKNTSDSDHLYVFFTTPENTQFRAEMGSGSPVSNDGTTEYMIDLSDCYGFTGTIDRIKITGGTITSGSLTLEKIEFLEGGELSYNFTTGEKVIAATRAQLNSTTSNSRSLFPDGHISVLKKNDGTYDFLSSSPFNALNSVTIYNGTLENPTQTLVAENAGIINTPSGYGFDQYNYVSIGKVYNFSGTECFGILHLEKYFDSTGNFTAEGVRSSSNNATFISSLGLGYSPDNGRTWYFAGEIATHECESIHPYYGIGSQMPPEVSATSQGRDIGTGAFVIKDGYVYSYMTDYDANYKMGFAVIKASLSEVISAARGKSVSRKTGLFSKFYNGGFTEPAVNGKYTSVIDDECPANHMSVIYSSYLNKYVLARCSAPRYATNDGDIVMNISDDLTDFRGENYYIDAGTGFQQYPTLVGTGDNPGFEAGKSLYLYYIDAPYHTSDVWGTSNFVYRVITFD